MLDGAVTLVSISMRQIMACWRVENDGDTTRTLVRQTPAQESDTVVQVPDNFISPPLNSLRVYHVDVQKSTLVV